MASPAAGPEREKVDDAAEMLPEEQDQTSAIRVVVRVRPLLDSEAKKGARQTLLGASVSDKQVHIDIPGTNGRRTFTFDDVLDESQQQADVFHKAGLPELLESVLHGYDGTVFAYGQTGSGKTHTMEGFVYAEHARSAAVEPQIEHTDPARLGIVPRAAEALFERMRVAERDENVQFRVHCSYMQIYNEKILDLLNPQHLLLRDGRDAKARASRAARRVNPNELAGLRMRYSSANNHFYVQDLHEVECASAEEVLEHFRTGVRAKIMGSHNLNAASSRSHCMFTIRIDTLDVTRPDEPKYSSRLALVDLAGSERVAVTGATGKTLKEAGCINKSLFALRNVITAISALQEKDSLGQEGGNLAATLRHIPFRDSKLTSLLQHCLGGTSHTVMIACVSPSDAHAEENLSTLAYASRAKAIRNKPRRNEDAKSQLIRKLKREVRLLRKQLHQAQAVSGMHLGQGVAAATSAAAASPTKPSRNANDGQVRHLKHELLSSITIMKRMHEIEKELRERMEEAEDDVKSLQVDNSKLHDENQRLREHEQVLLHLLERGAETEVRSVLSDSRVPAPAPEHALKRQMLHLERENERLKEALAHAEATSFAHEYAAAAPPAAGSPAARRSSSSFSLASSKSLKSQSKSSLTSSKPNQDPGRPEPSPAKRRSEKVIASASAQAHTSPHVNPAREKAPRKPQIMSVEELKTLLAGSSDPPMQVSPTPPAHRILARKLQFGSRGKVRDSRQEEDHIAQKRKPRVTLPPPQKQKQEQQQQQQQLPAVAPATERPVAAAPFANQAEGATIPQRPSSSNPFERMAAFSSLLHRRR